MRKLQCWDKQCPSLRSVQNYRQFISQSIIYRYAESKFNQKALSDGNFRLHALQTQRSRPLEDSRRDPGEGESTLEVEWDSEYDDGLIPPFLTVEGGGRPAPGVSFTQCHALSNIDPNRCYSLSFSTRLSPCLFYRWKGCDSVLSVSDPDAVFDRIEKNISNQGYSIEFSHNGQLVYGNRLYKWSRKTGFHHPGFLKPESYLVESEYRLIVGLSKQNAIFPEHIDVNIGSIKGYAGSIPASALSKSRCPTWFAFRHAGEGGAKELVATRGETQLSRMRPCPGCTVL